MQLSRVLVCFFALGLACAPFVAFADADADHDQAEVANAQAQLVQAEQQATELANEASQSAVNEREIAFLKSEAMRQSQLNNAADARALQQIATGLAAVARNQGEINVRNELAIMQIKANALVAKADVNLANAYAIGRGDEIANAQAQSVALHQLADYLTGTVTQQNIANDRAIAEEDATTIQTSLAAQAQNDLVMGDDDLLAADTVLNAADLAVESATLGGEALGESLVAHATASLANAEAMAAEVP